FTMHHTKNRQQILFGIYLFLYLFFAIVLVIRQPFGNPPDEYNRFLIPKYIAEHGTLPNGYDESIRIYGYGFSYGFQPILPYMLQGYTMRLVAVFTDSQTALLYTARSVNVLLGLCMAIVVWFLGSKWFQDRRFSVLFSFLVTFLPQSIYMHTYVNTDSCCMLSIAIMLYAVTEGLSHDFRIRDCVLLSVGIILCALSYYNAYGFILSCILLFTAGHLHR
ncbi:MAG: glycosyltransferase family 39 protein, partial [Acetatifactor sp.]|nr:glycosyltransferase family 39 protein [Acetatifactor sp.]